MPSADSEGCCAISSTPPGVESASVKQNAETNLDDGRFIFI
jgi:hypothetical protein